MPDRSRVTLKDIALRTGFTINTVSRALKDKDDISETTRTVIKETARQMGYIRNSIAGSMRSGRTRTIAVILGDISNPHFAIIVKEIEEQARSHHYSTIIFNTEEDDDREHEAIVSALEWKVDGLIICPAQRSPRNVTFLAETGLPFVLIGRRFETLNADTVICDDVQGGRIATEHLVAKGHRKILFLNGPSYISSARDRLAGYRQVLEEHGIPYEGKLVREIPIVAGDNRRLIMQLVREKLDFSGVVAFSDLIAWEVIYVLTELGCAVPYDIAVVGFDNIQSKFFLPCPLTSVGSSRTTMARRAVNMLLRRINATDAVEPRQDVLESRLFVRRST